MFTFEGSYLNDIKIKGSLFKTYTYEANNLKQIKKILAQLEQKFSDASHICYAYRICDLTQLDLFYNPAIIEFSTDDGEPSGTAGKPILNTLKQKDIVNRVVFVIRYFGGTKLGIPGLIDAYKSSAESVLNNFKLKKWILYKEIKLILDYKQHKLVENTIKQYNGKIIDSNFEENINLRINIPYKNLKEYKKILSEKSNGTIEVEE